MLSEAYRRAIKPHKCRECCRAIDPGETYHVDRFVWDGKFDAFKTCSHCMVVRGWLYDECGGWCFGAVREDISEHAYSGGYTMGVYRLAVGMRWKWRTPSGKLLPLPKSPKTRSRASMMIA